MSDLSIFQIAGSALNAQSVRLNTVASNLANADVTSNSPETIYRARAPVFRTLVEPNHGLPLVTVDQIHQSQAGGDRRYAPDHPDADDQGYVYASNVNTIEQMADMISASRSYQTNLEVMNTTKELVMQTLQLGR